MTFRQVYRLWWSQSWRWVVAVMAVILLIGMGTAVKSTQLHRSSLQETPQMRTFGASEYRKHPENYKVNGRQVTLKAYQIELHQFFDKDQYKFHDYEIKQGVTGNNWYYFIMLTAGLVLAFWGRRTHYNEFMLSIGVSRNRLFCVQLSQAAAFALSVAIAQLSHWVWVIMVIPEKYQVYRNLAGLFGSSLAVVAISFGLLMLGWVIGLLNDRFWLAALLTALAVRFLNGVFTGSGYAMFIFGNDVVPGEFWFNAHYYVASALAFGLTLIASGVVWTLQRSWSAEVTAFSAYRWSRKALLFGITAIVGGAVFGDVFFQPLMGSVLPWFELLGMVVLTVLLSLGVIIQQRCLRGMQHES